MKKYKSDYIIYIGRFQPFHKGHLHIVKTALNEADNLIIVIGSSDSPMTIKNPFTFEERKAFILESLEVYKDRIIILPMKDVYDDIEWNNILIDKINDITNCSNSIKLIGHYKDITSNYLTSFNQWEVVQVSNFLNINATDIRYKWFNNINYFDCFNYSNMVSKNVYIFMQNYKSTDNFTYLKKEFNYIQQYKRQWKDSPYPPTFNTVDALVIYKNNILLIKRGNHPGKGKLALPGGFINQIETLLTAILRELREETNISLSDEELKKYIIFSKIFDDPFRSLLGRIITNVYVFNLTDYPDNITTHSGDDASDIVWEPINTLYNKCSMFHDDHYFIIEQLLKEMKGEKYGKSTIK